MGRPTTAAQIPLAGVARVALGSDYVLLVVGLVDGRAANDLAPLGFISTVWGYMHTEGLLVTAGGGGDAIRALMRRLRSHLGRLSQFGLILLSFH